MSTYDTSRGLQEDVAVLLTKQSMCDSATDECNVLGEGGSRGGAGLGRMEVWQVRGWG